MKKTAWLIEHVFLLSSCLLVSCADLPRGQVTVKVTTEEGSPIAGATIGVGFNNPHAKGLESAVRGVSNSAGLFTATAETDGLGGFHVDKEGYYTSRGGFGFTNVQNSQWLPWNSTKEVVLRKIGTPAPMYARRAEIVVPVDNKAIGFDLVESDWVVPYGRGTTSDFIFLLKRELVDLKNYDVRLTLTLSNAGDGIQEAGPSDAPGSVLRLPREAPFEHFTDKWVAAVGFSQNRPIYNDQKPDRCFFFRVRSIVKDGRVTQAMYGKIYDDIEIVGYGAKNACVRFNYYLNPDGTRNIEFDPKHNLLKNLSGREEVTAP